MIKELIKLAGELDQRGLLKEADHLDAVIQKYSGKKVDALEAMEHEDHALSLEQEGAEGALAMEEHSKDLAHSLELAELIVGGTPLVGDDADASIAGLADMLSEEKHIGTVEAVLKFFKNMEAQND